MKILIFADYFMPTRRGGGPIQSLANFASMFSSEHELFLVTRDRDAAQAQPYPEIVPGQWNPIQGLNARYLSPDERTANHLLKIVQSTSPDVIYLNSFFSPLTRNLLQLHWLNRIGRPRILLAVRGELGAGALAIKPKRKRTFLFLAKRVRFFRDVVFQASSELEAQSIRQHFPHHEIRIAMNIPAEMPGAAKDRPDGVSRYVFLGRIAPVKNLEIMLRAVESLLSEDPNFALQISIHGNAPDEAYLDKVRQLIERCQGRAEYIGPYPHKDVWNILRDASFTFLPSHGENFAHSIYESAVAGVPFLISDKTPWTEAAQTGAGWVCDSEDLQQWKSAIRRSAALSNEEYRAASEQCVASAREMRDLAHQQHQVLF